MNKGYFITKSGKRVEFDGSDTLNFFNKNLNKKEVNKVSRLLFPSDRGYELNNDINYIFYDYRYLYSPFAVVNNKIRFILPFISSTNLNTPQYVTIKGLTNLHYSIEKITHLNVIKNVKKLFCKNIHLVSINLPDGILEVVCYSLALKNLKLPKSVKRVWCYFLDGIEEQYKEGTEMILIQKK